MDRDIGGHLIHHLGGDMGVFTLPSAVDMGSVYNTIREVIWGCSNNKMDILGTFTPSSQGYLRHINTLSLG